MLSNISRMSVLLLMGGGLLALFILFRKQIKEYIQYRRHLIEYVDKLPGPYSIPLLGSTWQFELDIRKFTQQLRAWGEEYSVQGYGMIRLWIGTKPLAIVMKPEWAKAILESNEILTKGPEYDILIPWLGTGLLISTGNKWRSRRKLLTPTFHFNVLNDFIITHDYQSKIFVDQLEKHARSGDEFDIFPYIKRCALDIICETSMGTTVSAQTNHGHPYVIAVQRMNELTFIYQRMPWMQWLKVIWYASGYGFEYDKNLQIVTDFTRKVIDGKITEYDAYQTEMFDKNTNKKKAFIDLLMDLRKEGDLGYEDIREEVDTFMFEGHDTTSASLGWTLWCLAHNQEEQKKVCEEVENIFGSSDREVTNDDLKRLKYLEKVIKESLRLFPSVPMLTRVSERDVDANGNIIPAGCTIVIPPQMIHCNRTVHADPYKFDPERFSEENNAKRHPYAYIPFSAGPRNCIGQKFALMEEKTLLSWFFRKYTISSDVPFEENMATPEVILKPILGFPVKIQKRIS